MTRAKGAEVVFKHSTLRPDFSAEHVHSMGFGSAGSGMTHVALTRPDEAADFMSKPNAGDYYHERKED